MNEQMPLERMIAGWMADEASGAPESLIEKILETTSRTGPRPRWWAQLAERPMRSRAMGTAVGLPNRGLVYATLIALLLAGLAALAIGASILLNRSGPADWSGFRGNADHAGVSVDGTVYFGTGDGFVVAVDAGTGVERWRLQPPGATLVNAPAFGNGMVYAGTVGAGYVAIDPASHRIVWRGDTSDDVTGTASIA